MLIFNAESFLETLFLYSFSSLRCLGYNANDDDDDDGDDNDGRFATKVSHSLLNIERESLCTVHMLHSSLC